MSLVFGYSNPALQKVLLELCFGGNISLEESEFSIRLLDQSLIDDTLSGEQLRVLPLLYRLTSLEGLSAESKLKIVNIYKHTLCRNSLMLDRLSKVQQRLEAAQFDPIIGLKGLPALAYLKQGIGARPMADVDVLVPGMQKRSTDALAIFKEMGYVNKGNSFRSITLLSPENLEFDIHWYLHDWALGDNLVDLVKESAKPHAFSSHNFLIPCLEHHLAHTLAHGVYTNTLTFDARWVFDFIGVFKNATCINEDRFVQFVNKLVAPELIREALQSLADELPKSIQIDRALLIRFKDRISTNSAWVSWLYKQNPTPNLPIDMRRGTSRLDRMKQLIIFYSLNARLVRTIHGLTFLEYMSYSQNFTTPSKLDGFKQLVKKVFVRLPILFYRLLMQR